MKIKLQLVIEHDDETAETIEEEIVSLERGSPTLANLGLTLSEGKEILSRLQGEIVKQQVVAYEHDHHNCEQCEQPRRRNGRHHIVYRTLFGNLNLSGQRYYHCSCQPHEKQSFSPIATLIPERTAPEFNYLQAKWSSLMSYGLTVKLLEEVLPLSANVASVYRTTQAVAEKLEDELGEEQYMYIEGPSGAWAKLPHPNERLFVGIDGGFIHAREKEKRKAGWFEVLVGKSLLKDEPSKRFAFVQTYDEKPKRRLFETLKSHGMQMNQAITFLSDGGDDVRELQYYLNPQAEHILDWFHVTMKITAMSQIVKGVANKESRARLLRWLERTKWQLWHGHVVNALMTLEWLEDDCHALDEHEPRRAKLLKAIDESQTYIKNNQGFIPNYAERYRYGEIISTAFAESAINEVVSKRMVKKQQMRWTKKGAHLLLQVRIKTLNEELRDKFEVWYPELAPVKVAENRQELPLVC